jgi:hypothetical protein
MILISHRGNLEGPNKNENSPDYIKQALSKGYECEIDVWYDNGLYYLGHDEPVYPIDINFLEDDRLWCHAKNLKALEQMLKENVHCFWHQEDSCTLTSKNILWSHPNVEPPRNSIAVLPEIKNQDTKNCYGLCSDYIENYL